MRTPTCFAVIALLVAVTVQCFPVQTNSKVLVVDKYAGQRSSISELSIADYVSYAIGGPVVSQAAPRDSLPSRPLFERARANLFVLIDGLSAAEQLSAIATERLLNIKDARFMSIDSEAGVEPSVATIVTGGSVNSFTDIVSQTFAGQSLTVAASGDHELATRLAVRRAGARHSNDHGYFWNPQRLMYESVYESTSASNKALVLDGRQAAELIRSAAFKGVDVVADSRGAKIILASGGDAHFSFTDQDDVRFVAELAWLCNIASTLKSTPALAALVKDSVPDSYAFGVSSLKAFGANPSKLAVAEEVLSSCLIELVSQLSAMYEHSLTAEVVFLAGPTVSHLAARSVGAQNGTNNGTTPNDYDPEMVNFQILLWTNIALVFVTIAVIYVMLNLGWSSSESDTMLYRAPKSHAS